MQRAAFHEIASPEDRREYRKWMRRMAAVYAITIAGGIGFAVAHQHGAGSRAGLTTAAPPAAAVVALEVRR